MRRFDGPGWGRWRIAGQLGCSRTTFWIWPRRDRWRKPLRGQGRRVLRGWKEWLVDRLSLCRGERGWSSPGIGGSGVHVSLPTVERAGEPFRRELRAVELATTRLDTPSGINRPQASAGARGCSNGSEPKCDVSTP